MLQESSIGEPIPKDIKENVFVVLRKEETPPDQHIEQINEVNCKEHP